jgi:hypothetical protein
VETRNSEKEECASSYPAWGTRPRCFTLCCVWQTLRKHIFRRSTGRRDSNNLVYVQCQNLLSEGKILFLLFCSSFNSFPVCFFLVLR